MKRYLLSLSLLILICTINSYASSNLLNSLSYSEKINKVQYDSLTLDFKTRYPRDTWGGVLSKDSILHLIDIMPNDSTVLNYIFTIDSQFNKTALAMRSSANPDNNLNPICYKNANTMSAFCPDSCNMPIVNVDGTQKITYESYKSISNTYKTNNPGKTWGGCFDKESMLIILNSIDSGSDNLIFRFYYNSKYNKIGIIFIGGFDENNNTIYYKNGINDESFCPLTCNN